MSLCCAPPNAAIDVEDPVDRTILLDAFRRGEEGAVREMYREYGRLVYAVALRVLGRPDLAQEAAQQAFVNAWRAAARIDVNRHPGPWLTTIAKRAAIDIYRREAVRPTVALDEVAAGDRAVVTLPPEMESLDSVWQVRRAIDELSADEATVVRMQHLDGMTHTEIAERLGLALGTVKSRSHRAHCHLATTLAHLRDRAAVD